MSHHQWPLTRAFRESSPISSEESLLRLRDGTFATVLVSASPTTDPGGRVTGAVAMIQDISAQRAAENGLALALSNHHALRHALGQIFEHLDDEDLEMSALREAQRSLMFDAALVRIGSAVDAAAYEVLGEPREAGLASHEVSSILAAACEHLDVAAPGVVYRNLASGPNSAIGSSLAEAGFRSAVAAPVLPGEHTRGEVLLVARQADAYSAQDLGLVASVGLILGLCHILKAQFDEYRHSAKREERDRLARDIHDVLAQMITSVVLQLEHALQSLPEDSVEREAIEQARGTARSAVAETRRIVWNLRSASINLEDPRTIVQEEASKLERRLNIKPDVIVTGEPRALSMETGSVVQRLTRVALDNVWSHSEAKHVRLLLDYGLHVFTLLIEDDGHGFDPSAVDLLGAGRVGLSGVAERARLVGGSLRLESAAQQGTRVWCIVPYSPAEPAPRERETAIAPSDRRRRQARPTVTAIAFASC